MRTPKIKKGSFSGKLIEQTERSAAIISVFEKQGFEVQSMEQFQEIVADLFSVLSGGRGGKKRGRKPGSKGPGRPPGKKGKRGRPRKSAVKVSAKTGAKRGRKPKQPVEAAGE